MPEAMTAGEGWAESVERSTNLAALAEQEKGSIDAAVIRKILDTPKSEGGATVPHTIFQFVAVPEEKMMWVKAPGYSDWVEIDLNQLFR